MSGTLNLDDSLPVLKVTRHKKQIEIYPVAFLGKIEEACGARQGKKPVTIKQVTEAARVASGIKDLTEDETAMIIRAAEEFLLQIQLIKKKLLRDLGFSGSTPASADSPAPKR